MNILPFILQLAALVFLIFAAFGLFTGGRRPVWGWLGLACWVASFMVSGIFIHQATSMH